MIIINKRIEDTTISMTALLGNVAEYSNSRLEEFAKEAWLKMKVMLEPCNLISETSFLSLVLSTSLRMEMQKRLVHVVMTRKL